MKDIQNIAIIGVSGIGASIAMALTKEQSVVVLTLEEAKLVDPFEHPDKVFVIEPTPTLESYFEPTIRKNDHPFGKFIGNHKSKRGKNKY